MSRRRPIYKDRVAAQRLRAWVEGYGTHQAAADRLGVPLPTLRAWIYGYRIPMSRAAHHVERVTRRKVRMADWHRVTE